MRDEKKTAIVSAPSPRSAVLAPIAALLCGVGCSGPQSALDPAGRSAQQLADLFWIMAGGGIVIWLFVVWLGVYAVLRPETGSRRKAAIYIIGGGVLFPVMVLTALLVYGLSVLPEQVAPAPEGSLQITATGHQWWWDFEYPSDSGAFSTANEIHLPVGEPVEFVLHSADVIHSFWIPALGGKVDMIPGRETRLTLHPTRTGVYYGVCAEFCGASHAYMTFSVVVDEKENFEEWLEQQSGNAVEPSTPLAVRGEELFHSSGCGACHQIRGSQATAKVGPDLTHVGSRRTLAAALIPNEADTMQKWIAHPQAFKPGALMPYFGMLPQEDLRAIATYLDSLE